MDNLTVEQRHKNMKNIRSSHTLPELKIMKELRHRKIYFASNVAKIIGKPDIVFRRKKVIVFIDSDFWHGHPTRFKAPKSNQEYWVKKITRNRARDKEVNELLEKEKWCVIRIWEHEIKHDFDSVINRILESIK